MNACWNEIGYAGDRSCPELARHVHCHACPVFSDAGQSLFDREPPPGYLEEWTVILSREKEEESTDTLGVVVFRLGPEWLALPAESFAGVFEERTVRSVPHRSGAVLLGVCTVQGQIVPCVSLKDLLGVEDAPEDQAGKGGRVFRRFVALERDGGRYVFPADEVLGVCRYRPADLGQIPATVAKAPARFTSGLFEAEGRKTALLDPEMLFPALGRSLG